MRKSHLLIFIGLLSLILISCNLFGFAQVELSKPNSGANSSSEVDEQIQIAPTLTPDPLASAKSCLANTWEIAGLSDYIAAAIPPDLMAEYNLQYEDTHGQAYLTLSPDGQVTLTANNLEIGFSATTYIFSVPVTVQIDGTATGNYEIDGSTLTITDFDTSGLTASAQALGENLVEPEQIIAAIPFTSPPFNTAEYACSGDGLQLEFPASAGQIPPLVFQAVK